MNQAGAANPTHRVPEHTDRGVRLGGVAAGVLLLTLAACEPPSTVGPDDGAAALFSRVAGSSGHGIVRSVTPAPVVPDGDVAGARTDFVINLAIPLDPAVSGRTLLAGRTIKVTLPKAFENTGEFALADLFSSGDCVPGNLQCNTAVMLQGWPQHPILPRFPPIPPGTGDPQYTLSMEGSHTLVYTADVDLTPGVALPGPGIKQLHLLFLGFRNPKAGLYKVKVAAETGPGGAVEHGSAHIRILPRTRPSIHITSVFNAGAPNTIYQTAAPGELTPLPYDLLLWNRDGEPFTGVTIEMIHPRLALLRQGDKTVGRVTIHAPSGAKGMEVFTEAASEEIAAPISLSPTARLTAFFRVGNATGEYRLKFVLNGGTEVRTFVTVE